MGSESFYSIAGMSEGVYKEKGSRFLAFAFPVKDKNGIRTHLDELRKKYFDARHHCYAYILGRDEQEFRTNDDGEPKHSAGDPILGQIRSRDLTNVLVVVVRYFGGTKLGISGLINAYKTAASDALESARILKIEITGRIKIMYPYDLTNDVMALIGAFKIVNQEFTDSCLIEVEVKKDLLDAASKKLQILKERTSQVQFEITY